MQHTNTHTQRAQHPRPAMAQVGQVTVPTEAKPFLAFGQYDLLTCRQAAILMTLRANPGLTVGAIAGALGLNKPSVTRSVDKLEAFGLARRAIDPADRRLVEIWPATSRKRRG